MGGIVSGLFGKGGSGTAGEAVARARELAPGARFNPYTVTTTAGTAGYRGDGDFYSTLSDPYQQILGTALGGAGSLFEQAASFDPSARAQQVFGEQAALLQPQFEQQATALQSRLFGGGRLGLRLAGESQGLGAGSGMVQPDALGLGQAQQQTLAQLAAQSRQQAFGEQAQLQQLAGGMLQGAMGISGLEQALMAQGLDAETARAAAAYGAGQMELSPYTTKAQMEQQQQKAGAGFFGGEVGGLLSNPALFTSDVRLKENIIKVAELANGINIYEWDWINENSDPTRGVIAQEIMETIPEAVVEGSDGYLKVNYAHPELQGVH